MFTYGSREKTQNNCYIYKVLFLRNALSKTCDQVMCCGSEKVHPNIPHTERFTSCLLFQHLHPSSGISNWETVTNEACQGFSVLLMANIGGSTPSTLALFPPVYGAKEAAAFHVHRQRKELTQADPNTTAAMISQQFDLFVLLPKV